jgi:uncharacterized membrane-anchored protein YitT (DUF2179 family)
MKGNIKDSIIEHVYKNNRILRLFKLVLGSFVVALVYHSFIVPNTLVYGGVSGLAIPVNKLFHINTALFINVANLILVIISLFIIGYKETRYTLFGFLFYGFMISVCEPLASLITLNFDSLLFSTLFYGLISGVGFGVIYSTGFNTGGVDSIVHIIQHFFHIPTGKLTASINSIIIIIGASIFGITRTIYAVIFLLVQNALTDLVLIGQSTHKMCYITTNELDKISKYISDDLDLDYTILDSSKRKSFTHHPLIMIVIASNYYHEFENKIISIDPDVKITSNDCYSFDGGRRIKILPFKRVKRLNSR